MHILSVYLSDDRNLGDFACGVGRYLPEAIDIEGVHLPVRTISLRNVTEEDVRGNIVIVGGGGLIRSCFKKVAHIPFWSPALSVAWGIGYNKDVGRSAFVPTLIPLDDGTKNEIRHAISGYDLAGIRDYAIAAALPSYEVKWTPCISCRLRKIASYMTSIEAPDNSPAKNDVLVYEHHRSPFFEGLASSLFSAFPGTHFCHLVNASESPSEVAPQVVMVDHIIEMMSERKCVITNSYHGAYWALLLNKPVILYGVSSTRFGGGFGPPEQLPLMSVVHTPVALGNVLGIILRQQSPQPPLLPVTPLVDKNLFYAWDTAALSSVPKFFMMPEKRNTYWKTCMDANNAFESDVVAKIKEVVPWVKK